MRLFKKILPLLFLIALISCNNNKDTEIHGTTLISGQIINPKLDYIIFSQGDRVLDTVKLDSNNFFRYKTDKIKAGLYSLKHNETQVFYIEPGDSLLLNVNTMDFDESLAYSGKGASQNNLLMDLYLTNESENKNLSRWYSLSPEVYEEKVDSLRSIKLNEYKDFLKYNEVSEGFKKVALASINYDYYSKKELYTAANMGSSKTIPQSFFDYRKKIDFGGNDLRFYYPYYRFLNRYFDNIISSSYGSKKVMDRNSFDYNYKRLKIIDSTITQDSLKNSLLRYNTIRYLLNAKNAEEEQKIFTIFSKLSTDESHLREIDKLAQATIKLSAGKIIPNILLVNADNVVKDLHSIVKTNTVLYFWSSQYVAQFKNIHNRTAELKSKYPEYDFIGINTDTNYKKWRKIITNSGYNNAGEFQLENVADAEKKLVLSSMNKVIILDKNSKILEGNTNMFNRNFEELLLGYLNK